MWLVNRPAAIACVGLSIAMTGPATQVLAATSFGLVHSDQVSAPPEYQSHYGTIASALSFTMDDTIAGLDHTGVASSARIWQSLHSDGQNVGLHLLAKTNSAPAWPLAEHGGAYANGDLLYFDTFQVVGDAGARGRIRVDFSLDGAIANTWNPQLYANAWADLYSTLAGKSCPHPTPTPLPYEPGSCYLYDDRIWIGSTSTFSQTRSLTYVVDAGTTFSLGLGVGVRNAYALGESVVDFSNTGFMQLTALDGLGIGSVSGLTYVAPPAAAVPEPPTAIMLAVALGTAGVGRWFRRNRGVRWPSRSAVVPSSQ
jgi:hypothetical protein